MDRSKSRSWSSLRCNALKRRRAGRRVTQQAGLTVAEVTDLRRKMRAAGASFKVAKNRLARLVLWTARSSEGLGTSQGSDRNRLFDTDPVAAAKVAVEVRGQDRTRSSPSSAAASGATSSGRGCGQGAGDPALAQ